MSPPLQSSKGGRHSNGILVPSLKTAESVLKELNFGLSDCSSVDSSSVSTLSEASNKDNFNFKATELRLGLPGSQSPERDHELCLSSSTKPDEKTLFPLIPLKDDKIPVSGNKRGFSDTMVKTPTEVNWMFKSSSHDSDATNSVAQGKFSTNSGVTAMLNPRSCPNLGAPQAPQKAVQEQPRPNAGAPAANRAQVVGWPPIRSFRKNTLTTSSKNMEPLFVKVSMDGAPYLRKVDLRSYTTYRELSSGLEKMFSCFTLGQCGSHGAHERENMSETKLKDLLHGSEYVLTYEDKDGDWMLVGDVPWQMFTDSCKRLKIMKGSNAIGLAPRAMEKSRSRN